MNILSRTNKEEAALGLLILALFLTCQLSLWRHVLDSLRSFSVVHTPEWNPGRSEGAKRSVLVKACCIFIICTLVCLETKCTKSRTDTQSTGLSIYRTNAHGILSHFFTLYTISSFPVVRVPKEILLISGLSLIPSTGLKYQQYWELIHLFSALWCHSLKRNVADYIMNCSIRSQTHQSSNIITKSFVISQVGVIGVRKKQLTE